jgi:hypothetical protein
VTILVVHCHILLPKKNNINITIITRGNMNINASNSISTTPNIPIITTAAMKRPKISLRYLLPIRHTSNKIKKNIIIITITAFNMIIII